MLKKLKDIVAAVRDWMLRGINITPVEIFIVVVIIGLLGTILCRTKIKSNRLEREHARSESLK